MKAHAGLLAIQIVVNSIGYQEQENKRKKRKEKEIKNAAFSCQSSEESLRSIINKPNCSRLALEPYRLILGEETSCLPELLLKRYHDLR